MKLPEVMAQLAAKGSAQTKSTFLRHGAREPFFGVKVGDMKPIAKKLRGRQDLALELYATGNGDAQYLAGMIADGSQMTSQQLQDWAARASWQMVSHTTVPWVAHEHTAGFALALLWTSDAKPHIAGAGWATLGAWVATHPDEDLDLKRLRALLARVRREIHTAPNRVRQQMNHFLIAVGTYVAPLADEAITTARAIGKVEVDVGDTDCKVPDAETYMIKSRRGAPIAPKRKTVRC